MRILPPSRVLVCELASSIVVIHFVVDIYDEMTMMANALTVHEHPGDRDNSHPKLLERDIRAATVKEL